MKRTGETRSATSGGHLVPPSCKRNRRRVHLYLLYHVAPDASCNPHVLRLIRSAVVDLIIPNPLPVLARSCLSAYPYILLSLPPPRLQLVEVPRREEVGGESGLMKLKEASRPLRIDRL